MPVSLLVDPGSSLVAAGKDVLNVSQSDLILLSEDSSDCQDVFDEGYGQYSKDEAQQCAFLTSYQSGQQIAGIMVQGPVTLVDGRLLAYEDKASMDGMTTNGSFLDDSMVFGVIEETFEGGPGTSLKNGIVGVDRGNISMMSQLYSSNLITDLSFGQCGTSATENGSFAVFGSYIPNASYQTTPLFTGEEMSELGASLGEAFEREALNNQNDTSGYYVVFSGLEVNGERVQNASYENLPILFDTGTPSLILPREYVQGIVSSAEDAIASGNYEYSIITSTLPFVGEQFLVTPLSGGELDPSIIPEIFPNITFILGQGKANITIPPEAYVASAEFEGNPGFTMIISVLGTSETLSNQDGLILGAPFIYERFVQVDATNSTMMISDPAPGCMFPEDEKHADSPPSESSPYDIPASASSIATLTRMLAVSFFMALQ